MRGTSHHSELFQRVGVSLDRAKAALDEGDLKVALVEMELSGLHVRHELSSMNRPSQPINAQVEGVAGLIPSPFTGSLSQRITTLSPVVLEPLLISLHMTLGGLQSFAVGAYEDYQTTLLLAAELIGKLLYGESYNLVSQPIPTRVVQPNPDEVPVQ